MRLRLSPKQQPEAWVLSGVWSWSGTDVLMGQRNASLAAAILPDGVGCREAAAPVERSVRQERKCNLWLLEDAPFPGVVYR